MAHGHFIDQCKHGKIVRECRCIGPKEVRLVGCACPEMYHGRHRREVIRLRPDMRSVMQTIAAAS